MPYSSHVYHTIRSYAEAICKNNTETQLKNYLSSGGTVRTFRLRITEAHRVVVELMGRSDLTDDQATEILWRDDVRNERFPHISQPMENYSRKAHVNLELQHT